MLTWCFFVLFVFGENRQPLKVSGRCRWISFPVDTMSWRGKESVGMVGGSFCALDHTTAPCLDSASTTTFSRVASRVLATAHSASVWIMAAILVPIPPCMFVPQLTNSPVRRVRKNSYIHASMRRSSTVAEFTISHLLRLLVKFIHTKIPWNLENLNSTRNPQVR